MLFNCFFIQSTQMQMMIIDPDRMKLIRLNFCKDAQVTTFSLKPYCAVVGSALLNEVHPKRGCRDSVHRTRKKKVLHHRSKVQQNQNRLSTLCGFTYGM